MVLFHLIFTLIKIGIQGSVYASIVFFAAKFIYRRFDRPMPIDGTKFWWRSQVIICVGLFFYSFTYWGDHGLGDQSRIPLGHDHAVTNTDGTYTYFVSAGFMKRRIHKFEITQSIMAAELDSGKYLVFDLDTSVSLEFKAKPEYDAFAQSNNLPTTTELKPFFPHYKAFWSGWRFWLLP